MIRAISPPYRKRHSTIVNVVVKADYNDDTKKDRITDSGVLTGDLGRTCNRMDRCFKQILKVLAERNCVRRLCCRLSCCGLLSGLSCRLGCRCYGSCCNRCGCCYGCRCNGCCGSRCYRSCRSYGSCCNRCGCCLGNCILKFESTTTTESCAIRIFFSAIRTKHRRTPSSGIKPDKHNKFIVTHVFQCGASVLTSIFAYFSCKCPHGLSSITGHEKGRAINRCGPRLFNLIKAQTTSTSAAIVSGV